MPFKDRVVQRAYLRQYAAHHRNHKQRFCACGAPATTNHCGPSCERCKLLTEQATSKLKQINCQV